MAVPPLVWLKGEFQWEMTEVDEGCRFQCLAVRSFVDRMGK